MNNLFDLQLFAEEATATEPAADASAAATSEAQKATEPCPSFGAFFFCIACVFTYPYQGIDL